MSTIRNHQEEKSERESFSRFMHSGKDVRDNEEKSCFFIPRYCEHLFAIYCDNDKVLPITFLVDRVSTNIHALDTRVNKYNLFARVRAYIEENDGTIFSLLKNGCSVRLNERGIK
jgi:hypothetical protein